MRSDFYMLALFTAAFGLGLLLNNQLKRRSFALSWFQLGIHVIIALVALIFLVLAYR